MKKLAKEYLEANSIGFSDGFKKGTYHEYMIGEQLNKRGLLGYGNRDLASNARIATLSLTDNLDEVIGFPLDKVPNYTKLVPLFITEFERLLDEFFDENPQYMSITEEHALLDRATNLKILRVYTIVDSYGFKFRDTIEGGFVATSEMGRTYRLTSNKYFGSSWEQTEDYL